MADDLLSLVRAAIAEPGKYTERGTGDDALITFWQARAVLAVLADVDKRHRWLHARITALEDIDREIEVTS